MKIASDSEIKKCPLSGKLFETAPGKPVFVYNGTEIHPDHAEKIGYSLASDVEVPKGVYSREQLSMYLQDIGLDRKSSGYRQMYAKFADLYEPI